MGPLDGGEGHVAVRVSRVTEFHHGLLGLFVRRGDVAVDCTLGNGRDALFLAEAVGGGGHLFGFDVQEEALASSRARLEAAGVDRGRFTFIRDSHARIADYVPSGIGAAVYNLGYLPGGGPSPATQRRTTLESVDASLGLLRRGGVVGIVLYYGHDGGRDEAEGLLGWAAALDHRLARALHLIYPNLPGEPPSILLIQRAG